VLLKGEYTTIQNAIEFSTDIQLELTQFLKSEYQRSTSKNLRKLSDEIQMLIDDYDMQFLKYIYQDTQNKIRRESWSEQHNSIMKHRGTTLKQLNLKLRKLKKLYDDFTKDTIKEEFEDIGELIKKSVKSVDAEIKEEEIRVSQVALCKCGIQKTNLCSCENPRLELVKMSNNIYCVNCQKWKCRCNNSSMSPVV
jgi:N-glycosylase/DNA lyase